MLIETLASLHPNQEECVSRPKEDVDQEQQKVLLVIVAHAVVDPWAVVVHSGNTPLTNAAVVALRGLDRLALFALL